MHGSVEDPTQLLLISMHKRVCCGSNPSGEDLARLAERSSMHAADAVHMLCCRSSVT
jgi:hypothetical protein